MVFLLLIFIFCWAFRYQRTVLLLEYYTHVISVTTLFFVVVSFVSVELHRIPHVFLVGVCTIFTWFLVVTFARFMLMRFSARPYKILIHPDLLPRATLSYKVKLMTKSKVQPKDLKAIHAVIVDRKYHYCDNWRQLIAHASFCDVPVLTMSEYEELIEQRLSLAQLNENWMYAGFAIPVWYRWLKNITDFCLLLIFLPLMKFITQASLCY